MRYRDYMRQDFEKEANEDVITQVTDIIAERERLRKIAKGLDIADRKEMRKALELFDYMYENVSTFEIEDIDADDKWMLCDFLYLHLCYIRELYDTRQLTAEDKLMECIFG